MCDTVDTKQCANCKLEIPSSNFTIHSVHCQRNFYLCSQCQEPVNYNRKTEHDESYHVVVPCESCRLPLEKCHLDDHLLNDCPYRKVKCQFCDIETKATDIAEHENYCGSRTEKCGECEEYVMLKYKSLHLDSNHTFIKLSDEPGPSPSWQYGRRTLCNFMPDLSAKPYKPTSSHKRKCSEYRRRSRNSESREDSGEGSKVNSFLSSPHEESIDEAKKVENVFKAKEVKQTSKRDVDDWPALASLRSLQISEEDDYAGSPNASNSGQNEVDDDLMYAIQVSQEINSHIWEKDSNKGEDENLKNSFKPLIDQLSGEKEVKKNLFALNSKPFNQSLEESLCTNYFEKLNSFDEQDLVKLPCEFCGALIFSKDLISHQSRCSLCMMDDVERRTTRPRASYLNEDVERKIPCGFCNKSFTLPLLELHQISCRRNPSKSRKNQDKANYPRNIKAMNVKSEPGLQNGLEPSSPRLSRVGTRSEWLSELSKSNEGGRDMKKNLNHPETGVITKTYKVSRKNRRAPSPPKM